MTDRNQALALVVLGALGALALWVAYLLLAGAEAPEQIQAGVAVAAIASNVVTGIAGFMAGRITSREEP